MRKLICGNEHIQHVRPHSGAFSFLQHSWIQSRHANILEVAVAERHVILISVMKLFSQFSNFIQQSNIKNNFLNLFFRNYFIITQNYFLNICLVVAPWWRKIDQNSLEEDFESIGLNVKIGIGKCSKEKLGQENQCTNGKFWIRVVCQPFVHNRKHPWAN